MELKVDIAFDELMQAIKHLPEDQLSALKSALSTPSNKSADTQKFQELLLRGPVMSDDQYKAYKDNRNQFNEWRGK